MRTILIFADAGRRPYFIASSKRSTAARDAIRHKSYPMKKYDTGARRALTEFMKDNAGRQFTADEIAEQLSAAAGKSTVYRLLSRLCDEGELRRLPRDGRSRHGLSGDPRR